MDDLQPAAQRSEDAGARVPMQNATGVYLATGARGRGIGHLQPFAQRSKRTPSRACCQNETFFVWIKWVLLPIPDKKAGGADHCKQQAKKQWARFFYYHNAHGKTGRIGTPIKRGILN